MMGLFGRKKTGAQVEEPTVTKPEAKAQTDDYTEEGEMHSDRMVCRHQLERAISGNGQGVVMKFYIENFKQMNELFGFSY